MVWVIPEVSKCSINSEQEIALLSKSLSASKAAKHNLTQLSHVLQLSLETDKILQSFFKQIKHSFRLNKLLYINSQHDISVILGSKLSSCQSNNKYLKKFELFYQNEYLGEINLASKHKFSPNKILELKSYINLLILPLKNSLLYSQALKATKTDPLTKLSNRLSLIEDLNYHFNLSSRFNSPLSVIFIDIDHFKKINDTYGHIIGDNILVQFAEILKLNIRKSDIAYRFGGEEFVVILENTNRRGATNLAKKLNEFIAKQKLTITNNNQPHLLNITISLGVATKTTKDTAETIISRADQALYTAKQQGRNQFNYK